MIVRNEDIETLADEWNINSNREEAIDLAQEVRDIYEAEIKKILRLVDEAEMIVKEMKGK